MGVSDPEVRKKLSEPRWLRYKHESETELALVEALDSSVPKLPDLQVGERTIGRPVISSTLP